MAQHQMGQVQDCGTVSDEQVWICPNLTCKKVVDIGKAVKCEECKNWYHLQCAGLNTTVFNSLGKSNSQLYWRCIPCISKPISATPPASMDNKLDNILGLLLDMNSRIANLETTNTARDENIESMIDTKIDEKVHNVVREELERERRKLNLIIYGLEENDETDSISQIQSVMSAIKMESQEPPTHIIRLGEKKTGRIRPTRITVGAMSDKRSIMTNAKLLRHHKEFEKVYISPDLTPKERDANNKLVQEMKSRREGGETELIISRGKIITRNQAQGGGGGQH
jgi:hypothetical protein